MNRQQEIQQFIVSLLDRILKVISDMNQRLNYVINLCLRLDENPENLRYNNVTRTNLQSNIIS